MANVIMLGTGKLICLDCGELVSNTANSEMRKEGYFSHSHSCGQKVDDKEKFILTITSNQKNYLFCMLQTYREYMDGIARMFSLKTANLKPADETERKLRDLQQSIRELLAIL